MRGDLAVVWVCIAAVVVAVLTDHHVDKRALVEAVATYFGAGIAVLAIGLVIALALPLKPHHRKEDQ